MQSDYASVNGLKMYYEIHGTGKPLLLLHGGMTTIDVSFHDYLPVFVRSRQVIAVEQQGHGHTADIDRPMTFAQSVEDTAAFLQQQRLEKDDVFWFQRRRHDCTGSCDLVSGPGKQTGIRMSSARSMRSRCSA